MRPRPDILLNSPAIELWPAWLLRARSNADARLLAQSRWVWRRKCDGRYLAALDSRGHLTPMLAERLAGLGLDADAYAERSGLALVAEPDWLAYAGVDRYRRALWLAAAAVRGWQQMQAAALADGIVLEAISGYRSHAYQLGIFERKRARGLGVDEILAVNAAPGFSEHHSGLALDIGTPGQPPAEESFETTAAFAWLTRHEADFGFQMSYPRANPHGIVYEPWHWRFAG